MEDIKSADNGSSMADKELPLLNSMTDEELLKTVRLRDKDAFKEIMRRYQGRVYKLVYRFTGNGEAAKELTQEIFFKVYTSINSYTPDAQFFTWLYRIATNHCLNYVRSAKSNPLQHAVDDLVEKRSGAPDDGAHATQLDMLVDEEKSLMIRSALDRLPDRQRMAIVLLRFDGLSYREIAQTLQCSVSAVESLLHRGMETLKQYLAHYVA